MNLKLLLLLPLVLFCCMHKTRDGATPATAQSAVVSDTIPGKRNPYYSRTDTTALRLSDDEWKKVLPDDIFQIARNKDTERAFTGKYWNYTGRGTYYCAACGNKLFKSDAKFASDCGWPSFFEEDRKNSVHYTEDNSFGMERIEVLCGRCRGHLGHLFDDGPPPTGKRFCMNSVVLEFVPELGASN
ncbi:MAG: peptide-methionine (R)-S-oxide reductase MsrB [Chryseolinea sp.]